MQAEKIPTSSQASKVVGSWWKQCFDQLPNQVFPWINLAVFHISLNKFLGPLPIHPPSIVYSNISNNMLTGEIPPLFCNMSSFHNLDLSNNNLDGIVSKCLGNSSKTLLALNLRNNSFHAMIPQLCSSNNASHLKMIDVSYNQFEGKLPRSLSHCLMLEAIVVSNNQLHDSFPSWFRSLPELKLLMPHQNGFYGTIEKPKKDLDFSNLQHYRITITSKGVATSYEAIPDIFAFIDLSDNRFEGEIPEVFRNLKALHSLNFSNNMLTGCIPSLLGNLAELESLDLSRNNLSCHIPQDLKQLRFLSSFIISHNNLTGPIPQGKQFYAFDSSSFAGNRAIAKEDRL
nr:receptor-like protein 54 [Ziziphus jujuba var. spinosa]